MTRLKKEKRELNGQYRNGYRRIPESTSVGSGVKS